MWGPRSSEAVATYRLYTYVILSIIYIYIYMRHVGIPGLLVLLYGVFKQCCSCNLQVGCLKFEPRSDAIVCDAPPYMMYMDT